MKIIYLILGIITLSIFFFFLIIYLNLFIIGYSFKEFVYFIIRSGLIWLLLIGLLFIYKGIERILKDELLLRCSGKFSRKKL